MKDYLLDIIDLVIYYFRVFRDIFSKFLTWLFPTLQRIMLVFSLRFLFFSLMVTIHSSCTGQYALGMYFMLMSLFALLLNKSL